MRVSIPESSLFDDAISTRIICAGSYFLFVNVGKLRGLIKYKAEDKVFCSRVQHRTSVACADPESFVSGGPTLTGFLFLLF